MRRVKLTERYIAGIAPPSRGEVFVWDTEVPGFGVRLWGKSKAYVVQVRLYGRTRRKVLGRPGEVELSDARERAQKIKGAISDGRDPFTEALRVREAWSLRDAMDYFLGAYALKRRLNRDYKRNSEILADNHFLRSWWHRKLSSFTQDEIVTRHDAMSETPRNANALLQLLSRLFTLGMEQSHCDRNPVKGIQKFDETKRDRFLSDRELKALWNYLVAHPNIEAASCAMLILLTGCRPSEAMNARWSHIKFETATWTKPATNTKDKREHISHLSARAVAVLRRLETHKISPYVFPSPNDPSKPRAQLRAFWSVVRKHTALPDIWIYDLRHTFASWLTMLGAGPFEVKDALGHASIITTQRYVHLADKKKRAAAEMMPTMLPPFRGRDLDQLPRKVIKKGKRIVETVDLPVSPEIMRALKLT